LRSIIPVDSFDDLGRGLVGFLVGEGIDVGCQTCRRGGINASNMMVDTNLDLN
jgi:hypothetical protein